MGTTYYVIAICFGNNTEYWNSSLVNDENTTINIENAECFETIEAANKELKNAVKPFGHKKCWYVDYHIVNIL